jgi:hypothetical protein
LRPGENGHSTLYVAAHGGREAIEVFGVDANGAQPVLTWTGCVLMPEGMVANGVASFSDGAFSDGAFTSTCITMYALPLAYIFFA